MKKVTKTILLLIMMLAISFAGACKQNSVDISIKDVIASVKESDGNNLIHFEIELSNGEKITKDESIDLSSYYDDVNVLSSSSEIVEKDGKEYIKITINLSNGEVVTHYEELVNPKQEERDSVTTLEEALTNTKNYVFSVKSSEDGESRDQCIGYANNGIIRIEYTDILDNGYIDYIDEINGLYYNDYIDHYYSVSFDSYLFNDFCYADFLGLGRINPNDFKDNGDGTYSAIGDINAVGKLLFIDYDTEYAIETFTEITITLKDGKVYNILAKSLYVIDDETANIENEVSFSGYGSVTKIIVPESILITDENYNDYFDEYGFELEDSDENDSEFVLCTIEDYASENNWVNGRQYKEFEYDNVNFKIECNDENSGKYYEDGQYWSLYSGENLLLVISADKIIDFIVIEFESEGGGILYFSYNKCESEEFVEVEDYYAVFTLGDIGKINITSITVFFEAEDLDIELYDEIYQGIPTEGNINVLVIPVEFSDDTFETSELETIEIGFNGDEIQTGWQSLKTYYQKSSFGKLNLNAVILDVYSLDMSSSEFQHEYDEYMKHPLSDDPIDTILDNYFAAHEINLNDYDANHDGLVDGVYVVYSYKYEADPDSAFWAWTEKSYSDVNYSNTSDELYLGYYVWIGIDFFSDPVIYDFSSLENTYINCNAQSLIHETGHMLGLDDYYDFNGRIGPEGGLGGADMMDYMVGDHNAVSKILLEWITDETIQYVSETNSYTIGSQSLTGDCMIITKDGTNSLDQEFILIELYTLDEDLSGLFDGEEGLPSMNAIRIYHVDGTKTNKYESTFPFEIFAYDNGETSHKFIKILEADGDNSIERSGYASDSDYYVEGSSLTDFKWYDRSEANFTLTVEVIDEATKTSKIKVTFEN